MKMDGLITLVLSQIIVIAGSSSRVVIYMTLQGKMQHSHQPPSPVGQAMQPCLWPLTMLEVELVVAEALEVLLPGIVVVKRGFRIRLWALDW
jgi:hypothetical protein